MAQYRISAVAEYGFVLVLNPMRSNAEAHAQFGPFPTYEVALAAHDSCLLPEPVLTQEDGKTWRHAFGEQSQLAHMNPLTAEERVKPGIFQHGIHEVFVRLLQVDSKDPV